MEFKDLKNKNQSELKEMLASLSAELRDLRFHAYGKELKQVHKINTARKDIARIKTLLNQK